MELGYLSYVKNSQFTVSGPQKGHVQWSQKNLKMFLAKNELEEFLLSVTKNCEKLTEQT